MPLAVGQGWPGLHPASTMRRLTRFTSRVAIAATRTLVPSEQVKVSPSQTIVGAHEKTAPLAIALASRGRIKGVQPSQAQPSPLWQSLLRAMQLLPHALPSLHVLRHPALC